MKNVLIVGANGFIGKHLSFAMAKREDIKLTLFSRSFSPFFNNPVYKRCQFVKGDFRNAIDYAHILPLQHIVYHLISVSFPASTWDKPLAEVEGNLLPSITFFHSCADAGVGKVVFISSGGAVYGTQQGPLEETSLLLPFSPYGITKASIEYFLEYFRRRNSMNYDIYRVSNAYGPLQDKIGFGVINTWIKAILKQEKIMLYGDGSISKDYIYISDLVTMLCSTLDMSLSTSNIYNACSNQATSLSEILDCLAEISPEKINVEYRSSKESDNKRVELKNEKILKRVPSLTITSIREGIEKTWSFYRQRLQQED